MPTIPASHSEWKIFCVLLFGLNNRMFLFCRTNEFPILPNHIIEKLINEKPGKFNDVLTAFQELLAQQDVDRNKFYCSSSAEELMNLCVNTVTQDSNEWREERRKRITGEL